MLLVSSLPPPFLLSSLLSFLSSSSISLQLRLRPRRREDALRLERHGHRPLDLELARQEHRLRRRAADELGKVGVGDHERHVGLVLGRALGDFLLLARAELEGPLGAVDVEDDEAL